MSSFKNCILNVMKFRGYILYIFDEKNMNKNEVFPIFVGGGRESERA